MGIAVCDLLTAILVCFAAGFVQGAVGFGLSLIGVPLMLVSLDVRTAVVIGFLHGCTTSAWLAARLRDRIEARCSRALSLSAIAGMPFGALILKRANPDHLAAGVGLLCLVAGSWSVRTARRRQPVASNLSRRWLWTSGLISGVLNTSTSTNGPPLVWALRRNDLSPAEFKATISVVFTISNVFGLGILWVAGLVDAAAAWLFAASTPSVFAGVWLGENLSRERTASTFFLIVDVLLVVAGVVALTRALS